MAIVALVIAVVLLNAPKGGPAMGEAAPSFTLSAASGGTVDLEGLLRGSSGAVLVFYRGVF